MAILLCPYINFKSNAKEAMEFYHEIFGGKLDMNTFGEFNMAQDPSEGDKIMHAMLVTDEFTLMASDVPKGVPFEPGRNIHVSLSGDDKARLQGYFEKLAVGGEVTEPFAAAPWGDTFGMVVDKFGIAWMVNATAPAA